MKRRDMIAALPSALFGAAVVGKFGFGLDAALAEATTAVTIAFPADIPTWDPIARAFPNPVSIYRCVFSQPLDYTAESKLGSGVVSSWKWLDTQGKVLELTIRDDVTFHNGDKLTSADIKFTFFDRPRADRTLQLGFIWGGLVAVDTPSPTKAIFHFSTPMVVAPQFLGYLAAYVVPQKYFNEVGLAGFVAKPIGSGAYRVVDYQRGSRIVLSAFEKFWRGPPKIKTVTFEIVGDPTSRVAAVRSGQADVAVNLPVRAVTSLGTSGPLRGTVTPTVDFYLVQMVNKGPMQDRNVRLAMHHAINKEALSKAFFSGALAPLSTAQGPGTPGYDPNFKFDFDPKKARALLADSGYGPGHPVKMKFFATQGVYAADFDMARAITQMWHDVGIEADLQVIELAQYFGQTQSGTLEGPVLWFWSNATADPQLATGTLFDSASMFSVWRSKDVTAKLSPLLTEPDETKRMDGFKAFDEWVVSEGYSLPLLQGVSTEAHAARCHYVPYNNGWLSPYDWTVA